jgi:ABC-type transport system substrate-binding protein
MRSSEARVVVTVLGLLLVSGCGRAPAAPASVTWVVGQSMPTPDPHAPPDPVRWAIERLIGRGLASSVDGSAKATERMEVSSDGLTVTFRLRPGLKFTDGSPCRAEDFRRALEAGLNRLDHSTHAHVLASIVGVDQVRPGRPLPPLGIAAADDSTLVLRLSRRDPRLLDRLALPGVGVPWSSRSGVGGWPVGTGAYAVVTSAPGRLTLARRQGRGGPDTIHVRFSRGAARAATLLRAEVPDLFWPLPPGLELDKLPAGFDTHSNESRPQRRLLLILRADLPPTSKAAARHALAHGLDRVALLGALGPLGSPVDEWIELGGAFEFPRRDAELVRQWLERGKYRRSLHVVMAYAADGVGAEVAGALQAGWSRVGLDVELRPLGREAFSDAARSRSGAQLLLVDERPLSEDADDVLASLLSSARDPVVGTFRTGWSTREFEAGVHPFSPQGVRPADLRRRIAEERVVVPLAALPWVWVERHQTRQALFHPGFGPDPRGLAGEPIPPEWR